MKKEKTGTEDDEGFPDKYGNSTVPERNPGHEVKIRGDSQGIHYDGKAEGQPDMAASPVCAEGGAEGTEGTDNHVKNAVGPE